MKRFCPRCERREVLTIDQEPYGNGQKFQALHCNGCGWGKIVRDDWYPEQNGTESVLPIAVRFLVSGDR